MNTKILKQSRFSVIPRSWRGMNTKNILAAIGLAASAAACDSFEALHETRLKEAGFTQEQAEVGAAIGLRKIFSDEQELNDDKVSYTLHYGGISDEEVFFTVQGIHQDLEKMLYVHDNFSRAKFLKNSGLQPQLERQEKIFQYHEERLQAKILHRKFERIMQGKSTSPRSAPGEVVDEETYTLADSFPFQPLPEFEAEYVKTFRDEKGVLSPESIVEDITENRTFYETEPNPEYAIDKGKEPERVVQRKQSVRIIGYNLDGDEEQQPDYLEVFRLKEGKQEPRPAIKVFKPNGTGDLEIVVLERDREGEAGYDIPDLVDEYQRITSGADLKNTPELMNPIFEKEKELPRQFPEGGTINEISIVRTGTTALGNDEINTEGWEQFLTEYNSIATVLQSKGKNKTKMPKITVQVKTEITEGEEEHDFAPIAWIALRYEVHARVMEFYKPNEKFAGKKYRITAQGRDVEVRDEEGQIKKYDVKALVQEKPYRIDFDRNQEKRWKIFDKDSDHTHYEAKRELTRPEVVEWEK